MSSGFGDSIPMQIGFVALKDTEECKKGESFTHLCLPKNDEVVMYVRLQKEIEAWKASRQSKKTQITSKRFSS